MISKKSRYANVEVAEWTSPDGRIVPYLRRRFVPAGKNPTVLAQHRVARGDRLDNVTARYLSDPEVFWRVADVNEAIRPDELTDEIGRVLIIPLPIEG
jgi:hypothetical protein